MVMNTYGLSDSDREKLFDAITGSLSRHSGRGNSKYVTETVLSKHDRFGTSPIQINSEMVGLTFITRPRLNLSTTSLRQDRHLAILDTLDPSSLMFSIRCNLDTVFAKSSSGAPQAAISPWVNTESPFNIPLGNTIIGMSGWPDFNVEYETTESGYFSEDMTLVRGSDRGRRTYNIGCTFRDIQGGYIMAYFFYWLHAMALQMEGITVAYPDDRAANRLNYTCSIYRFILDPSMRTIVKWAKATGCYPINIPIGDVFNYGPGDSFIHTSQQFTVQFIANNVTYMDPIHLSAFNSLVERYAGKDLVKKRQQLDNSASTNFMGVPYIDTYYGTNELKWLANKSEVVDPYESIIDSIVNSVNTTVSPLASSLLSTEE